MFYCGVLGDTVTTVVAMGAGLKFYGLSGLPGVTTELGEWISAVVSVLFLGPSTIMKHDMKPQTSNIGCHTCRKHDIRKHQDAK